MALERLYFKSEKEFSNWARRNARPCGKEAIKEVEKIIIHEKAHFEKAKSLGYDPVYGVDALFWKANNAKQYNTEVESFLVDYKGIRPTPADLIRICLAPKDPSEGDLEIVARVKRDLKIAKK